MNHLDPDSACADDILAVYLIINEEWSMSPGKTAAQSFQACQRLLSSYRAGAGTLAQRENLEEWLSDGTRTIAKFAPSRALFDRCRNELDGVTMIDEGLTEGTRGPTIHVAWPLRRGELPRVLRHKRIRLRPSAHSVSAVDALERA